MTKLEAFVSVVVAGIVSFTILFGISMLNDNGLSEEQKQGYEERIRQAQEDYARVAIELWEARRDLQVERLN